MGSVVEWMSSDATGETQLRGPGQRRVGDRDNGRCANRVLEARSSGFPPSGHKGAVAESQHGHGCQEDPSRAYGARMLRGTDLETEVAGGTLIWLVGGPSVGKSRAARAIQRAGGARDCWVLAGDHHLLHLCPGDQLMRYSAPDDEAGEWWSVPYVDGRVVGRPRAGRRALRLLDGMYRAAVAMTRAGNNVVLEDVVWEPTVAAMAFEALSAVDPFVVRLVCPYTVAVERELARGDRFVGGVAAYASGPELITAVDATVDTGLHDRDAVAQQILTALHAKAEPPRASQADDR